MMHTILICVLIVISSKTCLTKHSLIEETELVLGFMTHRHGDRTPVRDSIQYAIHPEKVLERTKKYGFGQLTNKGKERGYELGKFIRQLYGGMLSAQYNRSEMYIYSTDVTRTKMTVLTAMAAVYPSGLDNWSKFINWTPVPYATEPVKYDSLLATENCPVAMNVSESRANESFPGAANYTKLLNKLSAIYGFNVTKTPSMLYSINDMFSSQISLGVPLTPELEKLLPEIEEGAVQALHFLYADEEYLALQAGVLLKKFFDAVDNIRSGKDVPRIQVFLAHDINVYTLSTVSKVTPRIGVPKYASLFSLEARRVLKTGQYIVVPVYLKQPGEKEVYLQVEGCEGFCDLERFRELTSKYVRNKKEWRTECGFTEDFNVNPNNVEEN